MSRDEPVFLDDAFKVCHQLNSLGFRVALFTHQAPNYCWKLDCDTDDWHLEWELNTREGGWTMTLIEQQFYRGDIYGKRWQIHDDLDIERGCNLRESPPTIVIGFARLFQRTLFENE